MEVGFCYGNFTQKRRPVWDAKSGVPKKPLLFGERRSNKAKSAVILL